MVILVIFAVSAANAEGNVTADGDGDDAVASEIDVPSKIWIEGNDSITITSEESADISISGDIKYENTISPGKTEIPLKNMSAGKHKVLLDYLSNTTSLQKEYNLTVMKDSPYWILI